MSQFDRSTYNGNESRVRVTGFGTADDSYGNKRDPNGRSNFGNFGNNRGSTRPSSFGGDNHDSRGDKNRSESRPANYGDSRESRPANYGDSRGGNQANASGEISQSLPIPEYKMGWVIGKRGSYINQLQTKSGASITISDSVSREYGNVWKYIQISGNGRAVDRAKKLLHIRLERLEPKPEDGEKGDNDEQDDDIGEDDELMPNDQSDS
jgi:hypothetical protein